MRRSAAAVALGVLALSLQSTIPAFAEGPPPKAGCPDPSVCHVQAEVPGDSSSAFGGSDATAGLGGSTKKTPKQKGKDPQVEKYNKQVDAWDKWRDGVDRNLAAYNSAVEEYRECSSTAGADQGDTPSVPCGQPGEFDLAEEPDVEGFTRRIGGQEASPPRLSPAQAAQIAVAQLRIPTVDVGIGPDPSDNEWGMLAVGFPVWLYADGDTSIGPVTDSVGGVTVSIEASIASTTYSMGDGTKVNCDGTGTRYTSTVEPGSPSPTCGHVYEESSLPGGSYTVTSTTTWAVTWTAGGQSGVINVPTVGTNDLPIGELQAIVTN